IHWLPDQGPLQIFVHHNPLHHFEGHHFHQACEAAARLLGARTTFTAARYRALVASGRVRLDDVAAARARQKPRPKLDVLPEPHPSAVIMSLVEEHWAVDVKEMADAVTLRVLPAYLDRGSARWPMPDREHGLLAAVRGLARTTF